MEHKPSTSSKNLSRLARLVLMVLLVLTGVQPLAAQTLDPGVGSDAPGQAFAPGQLLVRFRSWVPDRRSSAMLAAQGTSPLRRIEALDVDVLRLPPDLPVEEAAAVFARMPEVEFAEPNYILQAVAAPAAEVEDQWGLQMIQAPPAWDLIETPDPVLLAVVDTGVDRTHSDLAGNIWANPGEVPDNGLDDDENGFVDDTWGWDFVNGDNDPLDDMMHGTAVSSLAAGVQDGAGVAGVCPWCQIVAVKVLNSAGSGTLDMVAEGIIYAADLGAQVINLSLGAAAGSQTLESAVDEAWDKGALVVAAAGNDGTEVLFYPAAYDNAMAIAATNDQDRRACLSNYGEGFISVAAPGEAIETAIPGQGYGTYSGTSLAAPHVVGLAGLLLSQEPGLSNAEIRTRIENTVEDLAPVGTDAYYGAGRINAYRAVTGDDTPTTPPSGLFNSDPSATGYAHARKLARDPSGTLHWVWHSREGGQYRVLYATSDDDGATWTEPELVFASTAETYHPALALGGDKVYVAFPSREGSATYRTFFTWKPLSGGTWPSMPLPLMGEGYDAVRPDLAVDEEGVLHLVSASLDNAPTIYYASSTGEGAEGSWSPVRQIDVGYPSRYASVYANAGQITIAGRTVEFIFYGLLPRYRLFTVRSTNGGATWGDLTELEVHDGLFSGEYGVSLAGVGEQLYLGYEHNGGIYFRRSQDGANWSPPDSLGAGAWPSITQAPDGQAWMLWARDPNLVLRHYVGTAWDPEETLGEGSYPNLKLGTGGGLLEWVAAQGGCAPIRLGYGSRVLGANAAPSANDVNEGTAEDTPAPWTPDVDDPNGDPLICSADAVSAHGGAVTVAGDCSSGTYEPPPEWSGSDSFAYTACDPGGLCDSGTVTYQVTPVNDAPVASFSHSCTALDCAFDAATSYDPDGAVIGYHWDFGDGQPGNGVAISHTYGLTGTYTVVLTVTDDGGATDTSSKEVLIEPGSMHVGDLDGDRSLVHDQWDVQITVTIHDEGENLVPGATVHGTWSGGFTASGTCISDASGQCQIARTGIQPQSTSAVFTVDSVDHAALLYDPGANHDPDGDSNGTSIIVSLEPPTISKLYLPLVLRSAP
ncbi:MAG: S8 family serine peptidase [Anaerolineae bacterium]